MTHRRKLCSANIALGVVATNTVAHLADKVLHRSVLSRTDRADAIELLNTTDAAIEVGAGTSVIHARTSGSTELMMELSLNLN